MKPQCAKLSDLLKRENVLDLTALRVSFQKSVILFCSRTAEDLEEIFSKNLMWSKLLKSPKNVKLIIMLWLLPPL